MTDINLEALGISSDDLQEKIVDRAVQQLLSRYEYDSEDDGTFLTTSEIGKELLSKTKKRLDEITTKFIDDIVSPQIMTLLESTTILKTNSYGEPKGDPLTFTEYIVDRAEKYMIQEVDWEGNTREKSRSSCYHGKCTRICYLIDQHLYDRINTALKDVIQLANNALADGIKKTVEMQMREIVNKIKIETSKK